jgi:hypothetical protein
MSAETVTYKFGELEFRTLRNIGLFYVSEKLQGRIAGMGRDALQVANREAWKLHRASERAMRKYANVTLYGCGPHDDAGRDHSVAEAICKATFKAQSSANGDLK